MTDTLTARTVSVTRKFGTVAAALKFVRSCGKGTKYMIHVRAFLPTEDGRGFDGGGCLVVSKADFLKVIGDLSTILVDKRGGKVQLTVKYPDDLNPYTWVSLS